MDSQLESTSKRLYFAGEVGKLTDLPLGLVDHYPDQTKGHMFQLPLCPGYHSERKKGKKEREREKEDLRQDR